MNSAGPPESPPEISLKSLSDILSWSHHLLGEVLHPGDLAVDLTAGSGHNTLFLAERVGPEGQVIAFDIQEAALEKTANRFSEAGHPVYFAGDPSRSVVWEAGIWLVRECHSRLEDFLSGNVKAAAANLGYLPGGDKNIITRVETTAAAVTRILSQLAPRGRLSVVSYSGHGGGREEGERVIELFSSLPGRHWEFLPIQIPNCPQAPRLLVVQKTNC